MGTTLETVRSVSDCSTCCWSCRHNLGQSLPQASDSFKLRQLLPAGTLKLNVSSADTICEHFHAEDGWHAFSDFHPIKTYPFVEDQVLLGNLSFLAKHMFISTTYRLSCSQNSLIIRIYLIPFDLPNIQGRLRQRDEATVLAPARKLLRALLGRISQDVQSWSGEDILPENGVEKPILPRENDCRTLAEVYSDLPPPELPSTLEGRSDTCIAGKVLGCESIPGMRSTLYPYQRRSVAAMLLKERENPITPDPLYASLYGIDCQRFYYQPATMEILRDQPMSYQTRGGVLCEELGTGKTVIVIAVILSTLDTLPSPEESLSDERPVLTPVAFRHFPQPVCKSARKQELKMKASNHQTGVPSLVETLIHYIRTSSADFDVRQFEQELEARHLWQPLLRNTPFYFQHGHEPFDRHSARRTGKAIPSRVMYLTSATLIVVPSTLSAQWRSEIMKHCDNTLRILYVKNKDTKIPPPNRLASDYDIVLMTYQRLSAEATASDVSKLNTGYTCQCPSFPHIRVPECQCTGNVEVSPLLQVRWKRLVIDEGHNSATTSTNLTHFSKLLSVERRWIVTGTPTTNLLGLNFGHNSNHESLRPKEISPCSASWAETLDDCSTRTLDTWEQGAGRCVTRTWTKSDREDLRKLANMMIHFLGVPRFAAEPKVFDLLVSGPLMDRSGPRPGAIKVLTQVMTTVMVRHRIEDVEKDVILPPLKHETVILDLDPYAAITYNFILSGVAINAVDSERQDMDYLFHPRNSAKLLQTMENISQSLFWHVDIHEFNQDLEDAISRSEKALGNALERRRPTEDIELLKAAIEHRRLAAANRLWRDMQSGQEVPYRLHHIPQRLRDAWAKYPTYTKETAFFLHPSRMLKMRDMVVRQPLISVERLADYAYTVHEEEMARDALFNARQLSLKRSGQKRDGFDEVDKARANEVRKTVESREKYEEIRKVFIAAQEKLKAVAELEDGEEPVDVKRTNSLRPGVTESHGSVLLNLSPLAKLTIGNSVSTKLNYILNEVRRYASSEKFLIFSKMPFTLAHIAEGLELANVKFLQFTTQIPPEVRQQLVTTFETSDTFRVFLMELKHGARGLNLISASRVIFCEPVWQADVESQAIKRAHRIGQTRPITVKTLAIRATFEEFMLKRRDTLKGNSGKLPGLAEESGIRHFLENPTFLEPSPGSMLDLKMPLLPISSHVDVATGDDLEQIVLDGSSAVVAVPSKRVTISMRPTERPLKKRKVIRFQDG